MRNAKLAKLLALSAATSMAATAAARPDESGRTAEGTLTLTAPGSAQVLIRGGRFRMGSTIPQIATAQAMCRLEPLGKLCRTVLFADEMVAHDVTLGDYWIDRYEVTVAQYERCIRAGACDAPEHEAAARWNAHPRHPMTLVSWYDANAYCRWTGGRLPTEAEWERAAKGWNGRTYPWGEVYNPKLCNHGRFATRSAEGNLDDGDGYAEVAPVGSFPQGRTPEGVHDLAGNVEEWVSDWYAPGYPEADAVDPAGPSTGDEKVVRGFAFRDGRAWMRTAARGHALPSERRAWRGFRCVREAEP